MISLIDRMKSKNSYYIFLEYCNGGDLASLVAERGRLQESEARDAVYQIVDGMHHLHSIGVVHRDLKLANLLVHFPNKSYSTTSQILAGE